MLAQALADDEVVCVSEETLGSSERPESEEPPSPFDSEDSSTEEERGSSLEEVPLSPQAKRKNAVPAQRIDRKRRLDMENLPKRVLSNIYKTGWRNWRVYGSFPKKMSTYPRIMWIDCLPLEKI